MEKIENCLYIVATPIGNLNEITPRALHILSSVTLIACEDTRETLRLLSHFNISKPLISCHEHNEKTAYNKIIEEIKQGHPVALVSDAGYPGISDPGQFLIANALQENIKVQVISGPCALINALVGSGLSTEHFYFHGFLNNKSKERKEELIKLASKKETLIFYESPYRLIDTLEDFLKVFGDRYMCACRELTKLYEEYKRGLISEVKNYFEESIKGEFVLVVDGNKEQEVQIIDNIQLLEEVKEMVNNGMTARDAIKEVSHKYNISKNEIYRLYHQ